MIHVCFPENKFLIDSGILLPRNEVIDPAIMNARNLLFHLPRRIHWRVGLGRKKGVTGEKGRYLVKAEIREAKTLISVHLVTDCRLNGTTPLPC
jgi:hypothetical protein